MSEPFGIELAVRECESGTASTRVQKVVAARLRERTSKLAQATERIAALEAEIARLREERKPVRQGIPFSADAKLIAAFRILCSTITTEDGVIGTFPAEVAARLETLMKERRWISVGERLPPDEVWVDVAGRWGDCLGWHDGEEWHNVQEDQFPSEVTHWRKRGPGPEVKEDCDVPIQK